MAVGDDDIMEGSVSSLFLNSLESNLSGDVLSPEDVAWVDSCLIKDSEISDSDWNSLKDALLDILSSQPDSLESSPAGGDDFMKNDIETLPSSVEVETVEFPGRTDSDLVPVYEEAEKSDDDVLNNQKTDTLLSQTYFKNPFLPNYSEDRRERENIDLGLDLGLLTHGMEQSTEDIFRVWDLDIAAEEDELVQQLNKALAESSFQSIPSTIDDPGAWKDLKESVDDLIAGIADLSLIQNSN